MIYNFGNLEIGIKGSGLAGLNSVKMFFLEILGK